MVSLVISEEDFSRLTPDTRRELLSFFGVESRQAAGEGAKPAAGSSGQANGQTAGQAWDPDGDTPYPLNPREAKELIRGLSPSSRAILKTFCQNSDGRVGRASLEELLAVSGHSDPQRLMKAIPGITRRLRTVTNNREAWLIDWFDEDWDWDDTAFRRRRSRRFARPSAPDGLTVAAGPAVTMARLASQRRGTDRSTRWACAPALGPPTARQEETRHEGPCLCISRRRLLQEREASEAPEVGTSRPAAPRPAVRRRRAAFS